MPKECTKWKLKQLNLYFKRPLLQVSQKLEYNNYNYQLKQIAPLFTLTNSWIKHMVKLYKWIDTCKIKVWKRNLKKLNVNELLNYNANSTINLHLEEAELESHGEFHTEEFLIAL